MLSDSRDPFIQARAPGFYRGVSHCVHDDNGPNRDEAVNVKPREKTGSLSHNPMSKVDSIEKGISPPVFATLR